MYSWIRLASACLLFAGAIGAEPQTSHAFSVSARMPAQDVACGYIGERRITNSVPAEAFDIEAQAGGWLEISMSRVPGGVASGDLDPFVRLLDRDGRELAVDDDSGGGRDAYLRYEPLPYTGRYRVVASRYSGTGIYRLLVDSSTCGVGGHGGMGDVVCDGSAAKSWLDFDKGLLTSEFVLPATAGRRLDISVRRDSGDMNLRVELLEVRSEPAWRIDQSTVFGDGFVSKTAGNAVALSAEIKRSGNYSSSGLLLDTHAYG